jgi:uncharacterized membrane protein YraQ (UPF0718 family)
MGEKKDYDPDVYRRLELVQKQFKTNSAEQKKEQAKEKRRALWEYIQQNQTRIWRIALYVVLGIVLAAVILVVVIDKI